MTKSNGKFRHANIMQKSDEHDVEFVIAVEERFLRLCKMYEKVFQKKLIFPAELMNDVLSWRSLRKRYEAGDWRHTAKEMASVKSVAEWTIVVKDEVQTKESGESVSSTPPKWER